MNKDDQIKGMSQLNRGSVGFQEALAKQEQGEPVAWVNLDDLYDLEAGEDGDVPYVVRGNEQPKNMPKSIPLYTTPQPAPQGEAAPVAENKGGRIKWLIDDWPQNCLLYTHPPKSFTYEQVKAHIRAASMSANDIVVGSDVTNDGVSVVIRRRDEVLYAEFFATPQPAQKPLTDEQIEKMRHLIDWTAHWSYGKFARAIEAAHGIKEKNNG